MKNKKSLISIVSVFMAVLMVLVNLSLPVGALSEKIDADSTVQAPIDPEDKIDATLKEKMATASPDEKIPVAIWYKDVDQEEIDTLTTQKVGYSQDDIAVDYEMPSADLLSDLKADEDGADAEMQAYMARTQQQREKERKRTDDYIMTRREFSRTKYNEKSAKIIKDTAISEEDITFKSQYAPMIIAEMTTQRITVLKNESSILSIYYYEEPEWEECSLSTGIANTNVNLINSESDLGLSGDGIKVGIIDSKLVRIAQTGEPGRYIVPDNAEPVIRTTSNNAILKDYGNVVAVGDTLASDDEVHADAVANTLLTVAPDIKLYSSNFSFKNIEAMLSDGVHMISRSNGFGIKESDDNYAYTNIEKWQDHIVAMHGVSILTAAGNNGNREKDTVYIDKDGKQITLYGPRVLCPGLAYNVITVGAYKDVDDLGQTVNTMYEYSSYQNSIIRDDDSVLYGCEKPDVVAPATFNGGGTSSATPFAAGMVALILDLKPSLSAYPQAIKAIVLASCHRKAIHLEDIGNQEYIEDGITDRQGAGVLDAFVMASIVSQGTYGVGRISTTATRGIRRFVLPCGNTDLDPNNLNVSITWLKESYFDDGESHEGYGVSEKEHVNLNLYVYRNGEEVGSSELVNSSTEMAYVSLDSSQWNYEIRIQKTETYNDVVRYGYAYSTDKPYIAPMSDEGVYYIRNYYSDKYLTLDTSTNETTMQSLATTEEGRQLQMWVIKETADGYNICPAYSTNGTALNFGEQVGSNPYYKAVVGTGDIGFSMGSWETDATLEPDAYIFTMTSEGRSNILSYTSSTGVFVRSTTEPVVNMYRMWVLEDINYRYGDINYNGTLEVKDVTAIRNYVAGIGEYKNIQSVLVDFNCDGAKNVSDSTDLGKFLAGLPY